MFCFAFKDYNGEKIQQNDSLPLDYIGNYNIMRLVNDLKGNCQFHCGLAHY